MTFTTKKKISKQAVINYTLCIARNSINHNDNLILNLLSKFESNIIIKFAAVTIGKNVFSFTTGVFFSIFAG